LGPCIITEVELGMHMAFTPQSHFGVKFMYLQYTSQRWDIDVGFYGSSLVMQKNLDRVLCSKWLFSPFEGQLNGAARIRSRRQGKLLAPFSFFKPSAGRSLIITTLLFSKTFTRKSLWSPPNTLINMQLPLSSTRILVVFSLFLVTAAMPIIDTNNPDPVSEVSVRAADHNVKARGVHGGYSEGDDHRSVPGGCFFAFLCR